MHRGVAALALAVLVGCAGSACTGAEVSSGADAGQASSAGPSVSSAAPPSAAPSASPSGAGKPVLASCSRTAVGATCRVEAAGFLPGEKLKVTEPDGLDHIVMFGTVDAEGRSSGLVTPTGQPRPGSVRVTVVGERSGRTASTSFEVVAG